MLQDTIRATFQRLRNNYQLTVSGNARMSGLNKNRAYKLNEGTTEWKLEDFYKVSKMFMSKFQNDELIKIITT